MTDPYQHNSSDGLPSTLYDSAISTIVSDFFTFKNELKHLSESICFDVYFKLFKKRQLCHLGFVFSDLVIFGKLLQVSYQRQTLHSIYQALLNHGVQLSKALSKSFHKLCLSSKNKGNDVVNKILMLGFNLGGFLSDAGWFTEAASVFTDSALLCSANKSHPPFKLLHLDLCLLLLHAYNSNCFYHKADEVIEKTCHLLSDLEQSNISVNKAAFYSEQSSLCFARSMYDKAYDLSCKALKELNHNSSPKLIISVLRQASRACVIKRKFSKAEMLIKYAVHYARDTFDTNHIKYAEILIDYGFYLLNVDLIYNSVCIYQKALDIRELVFGDGLNNPLVALAHGDLAYSLYVYEYSSGNFQLAKEHADKALKISQILPKDHLMLACSKRIKALILEEIAIDSQNKIIENCFLKEAESLHLKALSLSKSTLGEKNVQTAKHYGNLGRLFQSMRRYEEAEEMHLKAISIKKELLGPDDYEVALSVGHLASLYNYDMNKHDEAEQLYLQSIAIGCKLFGKGYSGLEYDYRGLLRLYEETGDYKKYLDYNQTMREWSDIRAEESSQRCSPVESKQADNLDELMETFFS